MFNHPEVIMNFEDISSSLDLEFDPQDVNAFYFSTSFGLFSINRKES